ncbi:archaeosortase A [Halorubrum sp. JWXQ-INN 858]|uniref:archaeosortase A n=1 Tax=Halorubrum sp. JWXQ-INN 858 TaxID=2690782 RepID=UPI001357F61F|nr:archaeosortase A [Halorubrum sp. JWXQ-INN 858]MWV65062.1 archaeosortase A [Halorubrum sp. JWXQ-INN 858]
MIGSGLPAVLSVLPDTFTFAWAVALLFAAAWVLDHRGHAAGRSLAAGTWGLFGLFWLTMVPYFAFEHQSYVESILALVGAPACAYAGYLLYSGRGSLFVLTRAVAVMLFIYLPFETIPAFTVAGLAVPEPRRVLIEIVATQTGLLIDLLGYAPERVTSPEGYDAAYLWLLDDGHSYRVSVVLACTGLGSMAIFGGLIAAVDAPLGRKLRGLAVSIPLIYVLNIIRTTFITVVAGNQYMHWQPDLVLAMFGATDPYRVSFLLSDRIISQLLAVVALVAITYLVARELPELVVVLEDVLYILTGEEHDLTQSLDLPREPTNRD